LFNFALFLERHGIPYVTRGPNVARGNINISCPWCGDDPSHHMGISTTTGYYGCWRDQDHRGKDPTRLIRALIGCSHAEAAAIAAQAGPPLSDFDKVIGGFSPAGEAVYNTPTGIQFNKEFRTIKPQGVTARFFDYVISRGFSHSEACGVIKKYNLLCATTGRWRDRIIIPVFDVNCILQSWTSRSILPDATLRYMSLTGDQDKARERGDPVGAVPVNRLLWNYDLIVSTAEAQARPLDVVICEGPFDAIKLDFFAAPRGVRATCLFTLATTPEQVSLLTALSEIYNCRLHILLDSTATAQALSLSRRLASLHLVGAHTLAPGLKDPGEMTPEDVRAFVEGIGTWEKESSLRFTQSSRVR